MRIMCDSKYQELLSSKSTNLILNTALKYIDKFRCKAEDRMLEKLNPPDEQKWLNVFYGIDEKQSN